jgi:hypothetical protein
LWFGRSLPRLNFALFWAALRAAVRDDAEVSSLTFERNLTPSFEVGA